MCTSTFYSFSFLPFCFHLISFFIDKYSLTVLFTIFPFTLVHSAISPLEYSVAFLLILNIPTFNFFIIFREYQCISFHQAMRIHLTHASCYLAITLCISFHRPKHIHRYLQCYYSRTLRCIQHHHSIGKPPILLCALLCNFLCTLHHLAMFQYPDHAIGPRTIDLRTLHHQHGSKYRTPVLYHRPNFHPFVNKQKSYISITISMYQPSFPISCMIVPVAFVN